MQRLSFILLLALSAIQCGAAVESSSGRLLRKTTTTSRPKSLDFGAITSQQQPQKNHRELSSSSSSSGGTWFAWLWYNTLTHLCPPHHQGCPHPCPPGQPNCHHSSSSSGGSSGGDGTANSSGGSSSGGSSGGTSYSNNGDGEYSNNDGWNADGHDSNYSGDVDYTNEDGSTWSDDGWNSSNLDNGNANGSTFEVNAQSIVPFLIGALVAGVIGAAFVVSRVSNIFDKFYMKKHSLKASRTVSNNSFSSFISLCIHPIEPTQSRRRSPSPRRISQETYETILWRGISKEEGYAR